MSVRLAGNVTNAVVSFSDHTVSLVAVITDVIHGGRPLVGYGFGSIGRYAQGGIIRERIIPRLMAAKPDLLIGDRGFDCEAIRRIAMRNEKPGGHGDRATAFAAVELAFWDLNAKLADEPAYLNIARCFDRTPSLQVATYAAGGYYYDNDSLSRLSEELQGYKDEGFNAFKIKIGGASINDDLERISAAIRISGSGARVAVDANGRFDVQTARAYGREIEPMALRWYEEIGDPLDYALNRQMTETYRGAIATGENLFSVPDVKNLLNFAGMRRNLDIFQMDAGLSYGVVEYARMLSLLEEHGFSRKFAFPHGGHLINLHIASGLNLGGCEAYPGVFQPFGGFSPECEMREGTIRPSQLPGFGLEAKVELSPLLAQLSS